MSDGFWGASLVQTEYCTLIKVLFQILGITVENMMNLGDAQNQIDRILLADFQVGMRS